MLVRNPTMQGALIAAHTKGTGNVRLRLLDGEDMEVRIGDVLGDALIANQGNEVLLIPFNAVASIRFRP